MGENVISVLSTRTRKICLTLEIHVLDEVPANLIKLELASSGVVYCLYEGANGDTQLVSVDIRSKEQRIIDVSDIIEAYSESIEGEDLTKRRMKNARYLKKGDQKKEVEVMTKDFFDQLLEMMSSCLYFCILNDGKTMILTFKYTKQYIVLMSLDLATEQITNHLVLFDAAFHSSSGRLYSSVTSPTNSFYLDLETSILRFDGNIDFEDSLCPSPIAGRLR